MNANNAASNTNRNNAGFAQEGSFIIVKLFIRVLERQIIIRQCTCGYILYLRSTVVEINITFYAQLAIKMKNRIVDIFDNITEKDVNLAIDRAIHKHMNKREVISFLDNRPSNCKQLYSALKDGSYINILSYKYLEKTNKNGKDRDISSPTLETRIYQHLLLNLLEPTYYQKDNNYGLNCKKKSGITATDKKRSVVHKMKNIFYDRLDLSYCLVIDQRKCYEHIKEKYFRKAIKKIVADKKLIDFAVNVCFVNNKLPIGTPTSPFAHHILMLSFDYFAKSLTKECVRYADDNFLAFHTKEEAQQAKWRIKNFWWYECSRLFFIPRTKNSRDIFFLQEVRKNERTKGIMF